MNVKFYLRGEKIHGSITWQGQRYRFHVGKTIEPKKWDNGRVSPRYSESTHINGILDQKRKFIESAFYSQQGPVTKEFFETLLNHKSNKSLFEALDEMINDEPVRRGWSSGTNKRFKIIKGILQTLDYPVNFDTINSEFEKKLLDKLLEKDLSNSTINDIFKKFKWFMRWSQKNGYHTNLDFEGFTEKMKTAKTSPIALSPAELTSLKALNLKNMDFLIRDAFLFTCYTGMRVSDLYNFNKSNVYKGFIRYIPIKKAHELTIPAGHSLNEIILRYIHTPGDKLFYLPPEQDYRELIKHICFLAGIDENISIVKFSGSKRTETNFKKWQLVSTHTGRRTFVSILANQGVSEAVISNMTGHSIRIMRESYQSISPEAKRKAVNNL